MLKVDAEPASERNNVHFTFINPVNGGGIISASDPNLLEPTTGTHHELCSKGHSPWLNGFSAKHPTHSYHPNQSGENAMGALLAEVVPTLTWPWSNTSAKEASAPVVTCPTTASFGTPVALPAQMDALLPYRPSVAMSLYVDNQGRASVLGPTGWTCNASIAEDSTESINIQPKGTPGSANVPAGHGIAAFIYPGTDIGDEYQLVCALFPASVTSGINPGNLPCNRPSHPPSETDTSINTQAVSFSDPPGVSGVVDNSQGKYTAVGVVVFTPEKDGSGNPYAEEEVCAEPNSDRAVCASSLNDFVERYASSTSTPPPTTSPATTTPTTAAPVTPASAPCDAAALGAPWVNSGIADFQGNLE